MKKLKRERENKVKKKRWEIVYFDCFLLVLVHSSLLFTPHKEKKGKKERKREKRKKEKEKEKREEREKEKEKKRKKEKRKRKKKYIQQEEYCQEK
jgi:Ni/Co efflux regulator RcnB